jgi:hypothetical protein
VADLDGDRKPDLIVANFSISVWLGNGDGSFRPRVDYAIPHSAIGVAVGDANGDGHPDAFVAVSSGGVEVLLGDGTGALVPLGEFAAGNDPSAVVVADINRDGLSDIFVTNRSTASVTALLSTCRR